MFKKCFSHRPLFNWAHRIVGNLALVFALAAIFLAFSFDSINLPDILAFGLVGWVFIYFIVQLIASVEHSMSEKAGNENNDDKGSLIRKIVAFVYFLFLTAFVAGVIYIIVSL